MPKPKKSASPLLDTNDGMSILWFYLLLEGAGTRGRTRSEIRAHLEAVDPELAATLAGKAGPAAREKAERSVDQQINRMLLRIKALGIPIVDTEIFQWDDKRKREVAARGYALRRGGDKPHLLYSSRANSLSRSSSNAPPASPVDSWFYLEEPEFRILAQACELIDALSAAPNGNAPSNGNIPSNGNTIPNGGTPSDRGTAPNGNQGRANSKANPPTSPQSNLQSNPQFAPQSRLGGNYRGEITLNKLRALAREPWVTGEGLVQMNIDGGPVINALRHAVNNQEAVDFEYAARKDTDLEQRTVSPWRLIAAGSAMYLWGWDAERQEPRWFRVSRIRSVPTVLCPGIEVEPEGGVPDSVRQVDLAVLQKSPLLWIRQGQALAVRTYAEVLPESAYPAGLTPQEGWDLCVGHLDFTEAWVSRIMRNALDVVVAGPRLFREYLEQRLEVAATWGEGSSSEGGSDGAR